MVSVLKVEKISSIIRNKIGDYTQVTLLTGGCQFNPLYENKKDGVRRSSGRLIQFYIDQTRNTRESQQLYMIKLLD